MYVTVIIENLGDLAKGKKAYTIEFPENLNCDIQTIEMVLEKLYSMNIIQGDELERVEFKKDPINFNKDPREKCDYKKETGRLWDIGHMYFPKLEKMCFPGFDILLPENREEARIQKTSSQATRCLFIRDKSFNL